jgi:cytochrome c oxidase subunit 1
MIFICLCHDTRYHNGFLCINSGFKWYFSNLLIPLQIGARDMASGFMNMISYWLFFISLIMISSLFVESGPANSG